MIKIRISILALCLLLFPVAIHSDARESRIAAIVVEITKLDAEYNKTHVLIVKRSKYVAPRNDAVTCGWLRHLAEINRQVADLHEELAKELCK